MTFYTLTWEAPHSNSVCSMLDVSSPTSSPENKRKCFHASDLTILHPFASNLQSRVSRLLIGPQSGSHAKLTTSKRTRQRRPQTHTPEKENETERTKSTCNTGNSLELVFLSYFYLYSKGLMRSSWIDYAKYKQVQLQVLVSCSFTSPTFYLDTEEFILGTDSKH